MSKVFIFWISFILITLSSSAQIKFEKEYRVSDEDIPKVALDYLSSISFDKNLKWFKEESQDGTSYEAKSKIRSQKVSIEFDTTGTLQDIEITIPESEIPSKTLQTIQVYLDEAYSRSKIEKIQKQWTGDAKTLKEMLATGEEDVTHVLRYEIMVSTQDEGKYVLYEYLFDDAGEVIRKSRVRPRHSDNLDF